MTSREYYQSLTPLYCKLFGHEWHLGYWLNASTLPEAAARLTQLMASRLSVSEGMTVLDLGCGVGGPACYLAETFGCRVVGLSNSQSGLVEAQRWTAEKHVGHLVSFLLADALELPFPDDNFDAIWSCEAVHNIENAERLAEEVARVLKRAGTFVMGDIFLLRGAAEEDPEVQRLRNYGFHLVTADRWISLLQKQGITVQESSAVGHHVGAQSLRLCTQICLIEAENHADGSIERVLCERTAEATSLLWNLFDRREVSWGIWVGQKL